MYNDLKNRTALITGSGKKTGIGYGISKKLASCGANIIIADLGIGSDDNSVSTGTTEEMNEIASLLKNDYKVKTMVVDVDVTSSASISALMNEVKEKFETIDILCNNAGASFGVPSALADYDEDAWMKTINVNLNGVFRMSKAVLAMMTNGGSIINTSSRAGKVPPLFNSAYAAAKAGVIMLTKTMAKELAGAGIRVNAICPGQIMTDLQKWRFDLEAKFFNSTAEEREKEMCKTIPMGRIGSIEEAANLVAFLASIESSYITGQALNITGGQLMEL